MKIAYLHGLESSIDPKDPKIIFLNDNFDKAYMPSINYRDDSTFDKLYKDIKSLNPDLIVGSSMGGYVSYLIGSKLSIPVLLFNPALVGRTFDPVVDDSNLKKTRIDIRFGKSDSVISGKDVRKYLKDNKVSFNHTEYTGGHRVPTDVFINNIKEVLDTSEIYNKIEKNKHTMKHVQLFEQFVNEALSFDKKGIKAKLEDKVRIAKIAVEKWGDSYEKVLAKTEASLKSGKLPSYKEPLMVQGDEKQNTYDIFIGRNAVQLAEKISKVIKKYKKYEVEQSSVGAAAGWSGTARSTVGGTIEGRANFSNGNSSFLIAVTCGGGIDRSVKDKMFQEIYELMFVLDQYNSSDGGVMFSHSTGTNYDTIGLTSSSYSLNSSFSEQLKKIMNG